MSYRHQSGAQKRKKSQKEKEFLASYAKRSSIVNWLSEPTSTSSRPSRSSSGNAEVISVPVGQTTSESVKNSDIATESVVDEIETENESDVDQIAEIGLPNRPTSNQSQVSSDEQCQHNENSSHLLIYDIGKFDEIVFNETDIEYCLKNTPSPFPSTLPLDYKGYKLSKNIQSVTLANGEKIYRSYLTWSPTKNAFCRLFNKKDVLHKSSLASPEEYSTKKSFKKLPKKLTEHENSASHVECFLQMNSTLRHLNCQTGIGFLLERQLSRQVEKWQSILKHILHVVLFLGERGLAFRGSIECIGDSRNGNFLGLLELLAKFDSLLMSHLTKVKISQETGVRMEAHYLSPESQNEFIDACGKLVQQKIIAEVLSAKYYSIIVDATLDSAHIEQTTFLLRFVKNVDGVWEIQERFLLFADCNKKKGIDIANLILKILADHNLSISNCRGQGYDNGSNMSGCYNG